MKIIGLLEIIVAFNSASDGQSVKLRLDTGLRVTSFSAIQASNFKFKFVSINTAKLSKLFDVMVSGAS